MRITFDPRAADELISQIDYLIEHNAVDAAARLKTRCDAFFEIFWSGIHEVENKFRNEICGRLGFPEPG